MMARIPNSSDASTMWKLNDVYLGRIGDEWPEPQQTKVRGWLTRFTGLPSSSSGMSTNYVNNWGVFTRNQYYHDRIAIRCTTHDWTLEGVSVGMGSSTQNAYLQIGVWSGTQVQGNGAGTSNIVQWNATSGNPTYSIPAGYLGSGINASKSHIVLAGDQGALGTAFLSQNTWYVVAVANWSTGGQYYTGYTGSGYGSYFTSDMVAFTDPVTGYSITSSWEWAAASTDGNGYFSNTTSAGGNTTQGPLSVFQVQVHS